MPRRSVRLRHAAIALGILLASDDGGAPASDARGRGPLAQAHAAPPAASAPAAPVPPPPLADRIEAILAAPFLADAQVSVSIFDLRAGATVYSKNPTLALNPASNVKLFTTAAALELLGPEHRFATQVLADPEHLADGTLRGPIYLRGSGDPSLVTGELYELATHLRAAGVTRIDGAITVDATRFDADGLPPGYDQKDEFAAYRAPLGAMAVNFNTYELHARPGATAGASVNASVVPPAAGIVLVNEARTVEGRRNRLTVAVEDDGKETRVLLRGEIGLEAGSTSYRYPVTRVSQYAGETFRLVLSQAGIRVAKKSVVLGDTPADAKVLAIHRSEPVSVLIRSVNKLSNNFMAEQLLRTLVPQDGASAAASLAVLDEFARGVEPDATGLRLGNGSGLYDNNRASAAQLTELLRHMHRDFRYRSDFLASLAVVGVEGTLDKRLDESPARRWVRAKSGTLEGVSALSGYAGGPGKTLYAFSILFNDLGRWENGAARSAQDAIVEQLAVEAAAPSAGARGSTGGR